MTYCHLEMLIHENVLIEAGFQDDNLSQQVIINSLREMGITRIVVAHRVSAVKECDHMIILDANGKVDCQGSYDYCLDNSDYLKSVVEN